MATSGQNKNDLETPNQTPDSLSFRASLNRVLSVGLGTMAMLGVADQDRSDALAGDRSSLGEYASPNRHLLPAQIGEALLNRSSTGMHETSVNDTQTEAEILSKMRTSEVPNVIWNGAALFTAGTEVRTLPRKAKRTLAYKVPEGTALLSKRFRLYNDGTSLWAAFTSVDKKRAKANRALNTRATFWVNLESARKKPGYRSLFYKSFNPGPSTGIDVPYVLKADLDSRNNLLAPDYASRVSSGSLATTELMPARAAARLLKRRGLVSTKIRPHIPQSFLRPDPIITPENPAVVPPELPGQGAIPPESLPNPEVTPPPGPEAGSVESLPGYDLTVSPEHRKQVVDATVKILVRPKGESGNWTEWCTGIAAAIDGKLYVLSASHCFAQEIGDPTGTATSEQVPQARNFLQDSLNEYVIADKNSDPAAREAPNGYIAKVNGLAMRSGIDTALLSLSASSLTGVKPINTNLEHIGVDPEPGSSAFFYSLPQANEHLPTSSEARYLGQYTLTTWTNNVKRKMYWFGIKNVNPEEDACNFGGSGSYVRLTARSGQPIAIGPVSLRGATTYPNGVTQPYDNPQFRDEIIASLYQKYGIDASEFTVLCGASATTNVILSELVAGLSRAN